MSTNAPAQNMTSSRQSISYHTVEIQGLKIFYREAGPANAPTVLLLHGFPSSSRMWEPLLPLLADKYHLIAPDYPGFGNSSAPSPSSFEYTFDNLARVMGELTTQLGITNYVLFMQDYGGPVGLRMALSRPDRVRAIIIQNAVSHEQGLSPLWEARRKYWADPAQELENLKANFTSFEATRQRHIGSSPHPDRYDPDTWTDEYAFLTRPGQADIQTTLFLDYRTNVASYPLWQKWLRAVQPPTLVVWGKYDPSFTVRARRLMPAMCQRPKSISWKRDISHWMKRLTRSHPWFVISSSAWTRKKTSSRERMRNSKGDWDA
jgi:pimeloyl-ACP methyl ester carboxylesterase